MQWSIVGLNILYATLGVVLMFAAYRIIDLLTPQVDFAEERGGHITRQKVYQVDVGINHVVVGRVRAGARAGQ